MIKINNTSNELKNKILFLLIFGFIFLTSINICSALEFTPEVAIPGFPKDATINGALLGKVINGFYNYIVWLAGILAVIVIMIAGFQWVTAAGNQSKIGEAKERITGAIIGLVLALSSYMLLNIINPELVKIQDLSELVDITPMDQFCDADQYVAYGNQAIKGNLLLCGEQAIILDIKKEKTSYSCYGFACIYSEKACFEKKCLTPAEICSIAGYRELYNSEFSFWTGKTKYGWDGPISSVSFDNNGNISGECYKWTFNEPDFFAAVNSWDPKKVYRYGFVDNKAVSAYLLQIKGDHSKCSDLDLKDPSKFMACKKSSYCIIKNADLVSPDRCVEK